MKSNTYYINETWIDLFKDKGWFIYFISLQICNLYKIRLKDNKDVQVCDYEVFYIMLKYSNDRKQSKKILRALDTCSYVCMYVCVRIFRVKYFSYISHMLSNFTSAIKISEFFLLKFSLYLFHKQIVGSVKNFSVNKVLHPWFVLLRLV